MFNAQDFIGNTRNAIKNDRRKAFWYKVAGYAVGLFGYAVFITGAIQGLALAPPQFRSGPLFGIFATLGVSAWYWLNDTVPALWWFFRLISPYPTQPPRSLSWFSWIGCFAGLIWLGVMLLKRSDYLSHRASEEEKALKQQAPLLLQIHSMSGQNIDISGDKNIVNAINTINNIRERDEKKGWWSGPVGTIAIGVIILAVGKFLHLN
jgi:hypothetical protein